MKYRNLIAIKQLQQRCEEEDPIHLKLYWDVVKNWKEEENVFFYYDKRLLVGLLWLYEFGKKINICGMVHPVYRRRGIFTYLLEKALYKCEKREDKEIFLCIPSTGETAKDFLQHIPCTYVYSEYEMQWGGAELHPQMDIVVREAREDDRLLEIELGVQCFGFTRLEATLYYHRIKEQEQKGHYMIEYNGQPIGKIRVESRDNQSWIYGFGILPIFQRRGIGKAALQKVIAQEQRKKRQIYLEVESHNQSAFHLYNSIGFQVRNCQDYYVYEKKCHTIKEGSTQEVKG